MERRFLFGQPVLPRKPMADGPRKLFVLGAYPSALHVCWFGPDSERPLIKAVAVDNEPCPFWTGDDESGRIESWMRAVGFRDRWGRVELCKNLNGSSGAWVQTKVLSKLGVERRDAWITDCLDTYFESEEARERLEGIAPTLKELGVPARSHLQHPSESEIVRMALDEHRERLTAELATARPERVVTLGNAALRVFRKLAGSSDGEIRKLSTDRYGQPIAAKINGRTIEWIPLAHPAAPQVYQEEHDRWAP